MQTEPVSEAHWPSRPPGKTAGQRRAERAAQPQQGWPATRNDSPPPAHGHEHRTRPRGARSEQSTNQTNGQPAPPSTRPTGTPAGAAAQTGPTHGHGCRRSQARTGGGRHRGAPPARKPAETRRSPSAERRPERAGAQGPATPKRQQRPAPQHRGVQAWRERRTRRGPAADKGENGAATHAAGGGRAGARPGAKRVTDRAGHAATSAGRHARSRPEIADTGCEKRGQRPQRIHTPPGRTRRGSATQAAATARHPAPQSRERRSTRQSPPTQPRTFRRGAQAQQELTDSRQLNL